MSGCTHDCNQGRNCTCQIAVAQPSRQTLQAEGKHPAPCARFCEARAFEIEIRQQAEQIETLKADAARWKTLSSNRVFRTRIWNHVLERDQIAHHANIESAIDAMKGQS